MNNSEILDKIHENIPLVYEAGQNNPRIQDIVITENGEYLPEEGYQGFGTVTVDIPNPYQVLVDRSKSAASLFANSLINDELLEECMPDTSECLHFTNIFNGCSALTRIPDFNIANITGGPNVSGGLDFAFKGCSNLKTLPNLDWSKVPSFNTTFSGCKSLSGELVLDLSSVNERLYETFSGAGIEKLVLENSSGITGLYRGVTSCSNLKEVYVSDASNILTLYSAFRSSSKLETITAKDLSKCVDYQYAFGGCTNLKNLDVETWGTPVDLKGTFEGCEALTKIPELDISKVTDLQNTLSRCHALEKFPEWDTGHVTNMYSMLYYNLFTEAPFYDTHLVTNLGSFLYYCKNLITVPAYDLRSATNLSSFIGNCNAIESIGVRNIKVSFRVDSVYVNVDSLVHLCYECRNVSGSQTLTLGSANLEKLASVYVKLVDVTDEMRAEDDLVDEKLPFVTCESTDEGAMLITDYMPLKNWALA